MTWRNSISAAVASATTQTCSSPWTARRLEQHPFLLRCCFRQCCTCSDLLFHVNVCRIFLGPSIRSASWDPLQLPDMATGLWGPLKPGLQQPLVWPPGISYNHENTAQERLQKRENILECFKNGREYQAAKYLREHADLFLTPGSPRPSTPSASPTSSKRAWERKFRDFKRSSQQWSSFIEDNQAVPRTGDYDKAARLLKELSEHMQKLQK